MLAAFIAEISERANATLKNHPKQTDSAVAALNVMSFWKGITNAQLAKSLQLSHTATVRLVDKLEAHSFVEAGLHGRRAAALPAPPRSAEIRTKPQAVG